MLSLLLQTLLAIPQHKVSNVQHEVGQSVLNKHDAPILDQHGAIPKRFTKFEQDDSVCAAGSRQWTGKVEVTYGNELFYCMFAPSTFEISLASYETELTARQFDRVLRKSAIPRDCTAIDMAHWVRTQLITENGNQQLMLNSGPGEACTVPLLNGGGPCTINDDGAGTVNSPHSWTTEFNVVYVDEIAGVGFSKSNSKPVHRPKTIDDVTLDLKYFLSTFVSEAFPELHGREFHVTGESYGGIQAISLAYALANPETPGPQPDLSLRSLVASSSFADISYSSPAYYDVLCGREHQYLNRTECATMARAVPECELAALSCRQTISDEHCWAMAAACAPILQFWVPPEKNIVHCMCYLPYTIRLSWDAAWASLGIVKTLADFFAVKEPCAGFPTCDPRMKAIESYMNNTEVQKKLGLAEDHLIPYVGMDMEVNLYMAMHGSVWLPTSSKYEYLLKNTSVRVLGRGGYLDPDTPIEGAIRGFEAFHWVGQAQFRASRREPWYYKGPEEDVICGGWRRGYGRLWFASFDRAGHLIDRDEPEASLHIVKQWIKGGLPIQA
ncbi:hypothetical protein G7054_g2091 [Neopestalotiopsis clavispora]|nr:hypothetical protein G7054_g2091 [Neopestalotiopsis clavispora]